MFNELIIKFKQPICNCEVQDVIWGIDDSLTLFIRCNKCKCSTTVPYNSLKAKIMFLQPYPKQKLEASKQKCENVIRADFTKKRV